MDFWNCYLEAKLLFKSWTQGSIIEDNLDFEIGAAFREHFESEDEGPFFDNFFQDKKFKFLKKEHLKYY